uniref:Cell division cycle protein 20 homolog (inferred by orthology to a human protein) n=1 Tax=Strongyloides venezuelensis TaxID=75913 RepID=A0A0K0EYR6_STRVS
MKISVKSEISLTSTASSSSTVVKKGLVSRNVKRVLNSSNASLINVSQFLCQGDRYIPRRDDELFDYSNHSLVNRPRQKLNGAQNSGEGSESLTPPRFLDENNENLVLKNYIRGKPDEKLAEPEKIWVYKGISVPQAPVGHMSRQKVLYSGPLNPSSSMKKTLKKRYYPSSEIRILDAPNLFDDFYSTPIHWGYNNQLAVSLTHDIYVYVPVDGESYCLFSIDEGPDYISSVQYSNSAQYLSVGVSDGRIHIIDVESKRKIRSMRSQVGKITCQAWNHNSLSVGTHSGNVYHHDVRVKDHKISSYDAHSESVCGLMWSPDKRYLASSGGDCKIKVWEGSTAYSSPESNQRTLEGHTGSVKAMDFTTNSCYQEILVSGGGSNDGTVKLWSLDGSECKIIKEIETHSPVTGIYVKSEFKEVVSFHGNPSNNMSIWKMDTLKHLHSFEPYTERIISHTVSPGHEYIATASADQVVRIWDLFPSDSNKNNKKEFEFSEGPRSHHVHPSHRIR